jgi:hypothetical protein
MTAKNEFADFVRLIKALEPWLPQIVIVGGWGHRLCRFHEHAQPLDYKPLMTFDTDVAVPKDLPVGQENIAQRLHQQGFTESFFGDHQPPVTQYRLGAEGDGFYAEFLTPLDGSGYTRDGQPDQTVRIAGVSSQKLRHLDILLQHPWSVVLVPSDEIRIEKTAVIYIANPTAFIVQKLLICDRREKTHVAKDVLYIHDTIDLFGASLEDLTKIWKEVVRPNLHSNHIARMRSSISTLFSRVNDIIRDASQNAQSAGRALTPEDLLEACSVGLEIILHD